MSDKDALIAIQQVIDFEREWSKSLTDSVAEVAKVLVIDAPELARTMFGRVELVLLPLDPLRAPPLLLGPANRLELDWERWLGWLISPNLLDASGFANRTQPPVASRFIVWSAVCEAISLNFPDGDEGQRLPTCVEYVFWLDATSRIDLLISAHFDKPFLLGLELKVDAPEHNEQLLRYPTLLIDVGLKRGMQNCLVVLSKQRLDGYTGSAITWRELAQALRRKLRAAMAEKKELSDLSAYEPALRFLGAIERELLGLQSVLQEPDGGWQWVDYPDLSMACNYLMECSKEESYK